MKKPRMTPRMRKQRAVMAGIFKVSVEEIVLHFREEGDRRYWAWGLKQ